MRKQPVEMRSNDASGRWPLAASLFLAPLLVFLTTPLALLRTLKNCRVLTQGRWEDFPHFSLDRAMWSLCYRFWDEALQKTGRHGHTSVLFPRPEPNTTLFMYPLLGLRLNHALGALTYPLGMGVWWASHTLYFQHGPAWPILAVMGMLLCSSSFYGLCFGATNYHVLAFMLFPAMLCGLFTHQPVLAAVLLLATVPLSPQVTVITGLFIAWWNLCEGSLLPVAVYLPAALLLLALYIAPLWRQGILTEKMSRVAGYLFHSQPKKFARAERPSPLFWNYVWLYGQFAAVCFFFAESGPWRWAALFPLLFLCLNTFVRVTDLQNLVQMNLALAAALSISNSSAYILASFALLSCPAARFVVFHNFKKVGLRVPVLRPVDLRPVFKGLDAFFSIVPSGEMVYAAYEHPGEKICAHGILSWYRDHFAAHGPYAHYIENLFIYALWPRSIALAPSTTMVTFDAQIRERCWGREPEAILAAMRVLQTRYCLHYVPDGERFDEAGFVAAGLRVAATLEADALVNGCPPGSPFAPGLRWHLLEGPEPQSQPEARSSS